jgi:Fic family protein
MAIRTDTLTISHAILRLIAEIDEFKGTWAAIGRIAPDRLDALRRVATIESIGSSTRIEGAKLSDREVETLLKNVEIRAFASRDEEEVAGYAETMETVFAHFKELSLTEISVTGVSTRPTTTMLKPSGQTAKVSVSCLRPRHLSTRRA